MTRSQDISDTLDALERKLRDLERELGAPAGAPPPPHGAPPASSGGGLEDLSRQIDDLARFREHLNRIGRELEDEYARVLARLEIEPATTPEPEPEPGAETAPAEDPGPVETGLVAVDAGPFADIDALAAFEQALRGIDGVDAVEVTGFEGRRALLEARLGAPVALEDELRAALSDRIARAVSEPGRLVVDLAGSA